jgi:acyl dehydratase
MGCADNYGSHGKEINLKNIKEIKMPAKKLAPLDQMIEAWGKLKGRVLTSEDFRSRGPGWVGNILSDNTLNREATEDGIRIFVNGEGDLNPLYRDPDYAKNTKYKCLIAPPNYLYTVTYAQSPLDHGPMIPQIAGYYSGCDREWFKPICVGDKFTYRVMCPSDNVEMKSKWAGRKVLSYEQCDYYRQGGDLVAGYSCYDQWVDVNDVTRLNAHANTEIEETPVYTKKEIEEIYAAQDREEIRGANPRYWEDVKVGDELVPVVRGPLSQVEMAAWQAGGHAHNLSDRLNRVIWKKIPWAETRMEYGVTIVKRHFAVGQQLEAWRYILVTNWMGDDGFLWKFSAQIRRFVMEGDTTWVKGKVTKKYCDDGKYCVDIDIQNVMQTGAVSVTGGATVILPSREHGPVVYPQPYARVPLDK